MAHGHECIHCGYQETEHDYPEYVEEYGPDAGKTRNIKWNGKPYHYSFNSCPGFRDGIRHLKICPGVKYCAGNCKKAREDLEWSAKVAENRMRNVAFMVSDPKTGQSRLVFVDMGS